MGTKYSSQLTNLRSTPRTFEDTGDITGRLRISSATVEAATTDLDSGDVVLMSTIPSNAKVQRIELYNDDLDADASPAITADMGLWAGQEGLTVGATKYADSEVLDEDCYATLTTQLQAASVSGSTNFAFEAKDIANSQKAAWEDAGLASDPKGELYIGLKIETVAATQAAGTISMKVYYTVD
jgi:tetrahydromethanopterin S-methyltransferase subunit B